MADVQWQRPNDLRVDVVGRRSRSRSQDLQLSSVWDRPWFVPRAVDDSVRIFSDEFPATGALHPLAATGPEWYHYSLSSELSVAPGQGRALRLLRVDVTPRRTGPALIAGQMWIDSATAEVVRLTFRYVGTGLWVKPDGTTRSDSSAARRRNALANQIVSIDADLEYGLQDARYWMPYRQVILGRVRIPVVSDLVIPFSAVTTFEDFEINTGRPVAFELPLPAEGDSAGRRETREARRDSLRAERRRGDRAGRRQPPVVELRRPVGRRSIRAAPALQRLARPLPRGGWTRSRSSRTRRTPVARAPPSRAWLAWPNPSPIL